MRSSDLDIHAPGDPGPDAETERAVRTTSGAAYAVHAAVQAVQKKGEPLYRVVVDGSYTEAERREMAWI